jgi:hypothetical protein
MTQLNVEMDDQGQALVSPFVAEFRITSALRTAPD